MTYDDVARIRRDAAIEGELQVICAIPNNAFSGVQAPHVLGSELLKDSVARIRKLIGSTA